MEGHSNPQFLAAEGDKDGNEKVGRKILRITPKLTV